MSGEARTWFQDKRKQSAYVIRDGKIVYHVKATPDHPGGNRHILTCLELPHWQGRCAYAGDDPRDNAVFQFWMQSRDARAVVEGPKP